MLAKPKHHFQVKEASLSMLVATKN